MKAETRIKDQILGFGLMAVFIFSSVAVNGQARQRAEIQENVKVKIYRSLADVLNDNADKTVIVDYISIPKEYGITYHRILIDRKVGREIGRVYGFRVGDEVYINPRNPKLRKNKDFYQMEFIGDYVNYATVGEVWIPNRANFGLPAYRFTYPREELLSIETGKRKLLIRARLKKILKSGNNMDLWEEFRKEPHKSMQLIPYLKQHEESTALN